MFAFEVLTASQCTYLTNFKKLKEVLSMFDLTSGVSLQKTRKLINKDNIKNNLIFISINLGFLKNTIKQLEKNWL